MKITIPDRQVARPSSAGAPLVPLGTAGIEAATRSRGAQQLQHAVEDLSDRIRQGRVRAEVSERLSRAQLRYEVDFWPSRSTQEDRFDTLETDAAQVQDEILREVADGLVDPDAQRILNERLSSYFTEKRIQAANLAHQQELKYIDGKFNVALSNSQQLIAGEENPQKRERMIADLGASLQGLVASGVYSERQAEALWNSFISDTQSEIFERQIRTDVHGAITSLTSDHAIPGLTEANRNTLLRKAYAERNRLDEDARRARAEQDAALSQQRAFAASELELGVRSGELAEDAIQDAFERQIITGSKRTDLMLEAKKQRVEAMERAELIQTVSASISSGTPLDGKDKKHLAAVDDYFEQVVGSSLMTPDGVSQTVTLVRQTQIVPTQVRSTVRSMARSGSLEQAAGAAELVARLSEQAPQALESIPKDEIAFSMQVVNAVTAGMSPERAVKLARERTYEQGEAERKAAAERYRDHRPKNRDRLQDFIDDDFDTVFSRQPETTVALEADFESLAELYFAKTQDIDLARNLAWSDVKRVWGATEADGTRRMMRYPPELLYGVDDDHEWIQDQLAADVKALGVEGSVRIVADDRTAREPVPTYALMRIREDGLPEPVLDEQNRPARWRPEFAQSERGKRVAAERDAMVKSARQRANHLRKIQILSDLVPSRQERIDRLSRLSIQGGR